MGRHVEWVAKWLTYFRYFVGLGGITLTFYWRSVSGPLLRQRRKVCLDVHARYFQNVTCLINHCFVVTRCDSSTSSQREPPTISFILLLMFTMPDCNKLIPRFFFVINSFGFWLICSLGWDVVPLDQKEDHGKNAYTHIFPASQSILTYSVFMKIPWYWALICFSSHWECQKQHFRC